MSKIRVIDDRNLTGPKGKGWIMCQELECGDVFQTEDGELGVRGDDGAITFPVGTGLTCGDNLDVFSESELEEDALTTVLHKPDVRLVIGIETVE